MQNFNDPCIQRADPPGSSSRAGKTKARRWFPCWSSGPVCPVDWSRDKTTPQFDSVTWRRRALKQLRAARKLWGEAEFSWSITATLMSLWCVSGCAAAFFSAGIKTSRATDRRLPAAAGMDWGILQGCFLKSAVRFTLPLFPLVDSRSRF